MNLGLRTNTLRNVNRKKDKICAVLSLAHATPFTLTIGMSNPSDCALSHPSTLWHIPLKPSMSGAAQLKGSSDLST